jgi:O-antigen/teichoic acid export membrane protein
MAETSQIRHLFKNVGILSMTRAFEFMVGLVRIKLSALLLGVKGVGIVDQFTFFAQQSAMFSIMSLNEGLVKQISESNDVTKIKASTNTALKCYMILVGVFTFGCCSLMFYLSSSGTRFLFGADEFKYIYYLAIVCLPLLVMNSIPYALLKAFKGTAEIAKARMISVSINVAILIPMILVWGLDGVIISIVCSYFVILAVNYHFARDSYLKKLEISFTSVFSAPISRDNFLELLLFAGFGASVGVFSFVSEFLIRNLLIDSLGVEAIGLYSPIIAFASIFMSVVTPALSTYLYPRFCEFTSDIAVNELINIGLRVTTLIITPFILLAIPMRYFFIEALYSKEFIAAGDLLPIHFLGLVFYIWWFVLSQSLAPTGRIKAHGVMLMVSLLFNILVVYFMVESWGLQSYALRYLLGPVFLVVLYFSFARNEMGFRLSGENRSLMIGAFVVSLLSVCMSFYLHSTAKEVLIGLILIFIFSFLVSDSEKLFIKNKLEVVKSRFWQH